MLELTNCPESPHALHEAYPNKDDDDGEDVLRGEAQALDIHKDVDDMQECDQQ